MKNILPDETGHVLDNNVEKVELTDVSFWLQRFVLEVRKSNGESFSPDSLYQLCCGIQRALREAGHDVNIFEQFQFVQFWSVLDAELKHLNAIGNYIEKRRQMLLLMKWKKGYGHWVY